MISVRSWVGLLAALFLSAPLSAADAKAERYDGADELAARIDRLLEEAWKKADITPARPADDSEFLRRTYLDLSGRIPSVAETRAFLDDKRSDKRSRLVESLLAGQRYPTYFSSVWLTLLLPELNDSPRVQAQLFDRWLRDWLASDHGYDWMVRELLTATVEPGGGRDRTPFGSAPNIFFLSKENKPEELAGATSKVFLGVNLQCAQCHNHPFASWKKEQFWSFAAFFSETSFRGMRAPGREREPARARIGELTIPGTDKVVKAKYLGGKEAELKAGVSTRRTLVDWMTAADNPFFARTAANRLWAHFIGSGLIEPLDEMVGAETIPAHVAILDELAASFVKHKYDPRWLIRVITSTRAYQLSSARSHPSHEDGRQFSRMTLRGLSGEQLYDSLAVATGFRDQPGVGRGNPLGGGASRREFLTKFASTSDRATETQTSILQALTLMNGRLMSTATSLRSSEALVAVVEAPFLDVPGKVEVLFLSTLSRKPTTKEMDRFTRYVEKGSRQQGEALADVFWALLNSAEFVVNH